MPIAPKPVVEMDVIATRFPKELLSDLDAYCRYLGGASDRSYVIVEAVRHAIAKDRGYQRTRRHVAASTGAPAPGSEARPVTPAGAPSRPGHRPSAAADPKPQGAA
jgi:hypothetical protein